MIDFPRDLHENILHDRRSFGAALDSNMLPLFAVTPSSQGSSASSSASTTPNGHAAKSSIVRGQGLHYSPSTTQADLNASRVYSSASAEGEWVYYCIDRSDNGVKVVEHNLRQQSPQRSKLQPSSDTLFAQSLLKAYAEATSWWYRFFTMTACYSASLTKVQPFPKI